MSQKSLFSFVLVFIWAIQLAFVNCNECPTSSEFWCSSPEIAYRCGVLNQCKQSVWDVEHVKNDASPVSLGVYIESLCPDCRNFVGTQLWPVWKQIGSIMDLSVIPYGNAEEKQVGGHWEYQCQHGADECAGNLIETCAIHILKDVSKWMPFIACMETSNVSPSIQAAKQCAGSLSITYGPIDNCTHSSLGNQLQHQMAVKTDALNPKHQYVPWVTLNGVHTEDIQNEAQKNLLRLICTTYKGSPKPQACIKEHLAIRRPCFGKGRRNL